MYDRNTVIEFNKDTDKSRGSTINYSQYTFFSMIDFVSIIKASIVSHNTCFLFVIFAVRCRGIFLINERKKEYQFSFSFKNLL